MSKHLLAIATIAAAFSGAAFADDGSVYPNDFQSTRTRAEVRAEAVQVAGKRIIEPEGSSFTQPFQSAAERQVVRAQAAEAVRLGQIMEAGDLSRYN
jgi:hypothetical protein